MLELVDVSRRFGSLKALDGVSFSVAEGQMLGFVGPNGAGKTSAMRIVLGVLAADGGEVRWRGRPVDAAARRRFGYMPEERGLYPKMRILDELVYLGRLHGMDAADARASALRQLEVLGLERSEPVGPASGFEPLTSRARDRVESLSLGNQQRVQLAAALVHRPELLVLDEPFSGLDPAGVDALSEVLRERTRAGVPVVFSSHQLELVERLCDSVVVIDHGRVVAAGTVEKLRAAGDRRLVRVEVSGAAPDWFAGLRGVRLVDRSPAGVVLELEAGTRESGVLDAARAAGDVTFFSAMRPSLTELFREVVRP
jgi:ABC-2 type transport system ATP-binding protein